jgi:hypothetical protein
VRSSAEERQQYARDQEVAEQARRLHLCQSVLPMRSLSFPSIPAGGKGAVQSREDEVLRTTKDLRTLGPAKEAWTAFLACTVGLTARSRLARYAQTGLHVGKLPRQFVRSSRSHVAPVEFFGQRCVCWVRDCLTLDHLWLPKNESGLFHNVYVRTRPPRVQSPATLSVL